MKYVLLILLMWFYVGDVVGQDADSCHQIIRYLVDKKGNSTGVVDTPGDCMKPCKGYYTAIIDKGPFLGRRETYYEACTGKWIKIEYYFLGIRTRIRRNPAFEE